MAIRCWCGSGAVEEGNQVNDDTSYTVLSDSRWYQNGSDCHNTCSIQSFSAYRTPSIYQLRFLGNAIKRLSHLPFTAGFPFAPVTNFCP